MVTLKTHAKITLVVRREGDRLRRYCHIGTGNYNASTALAYEDVGLFTADPDIGADIGELFNLLTGTGEPPTFRRLVVSPLSSREHLLSCIEAEARAGGDGRITLKTNGLTDPTIIDALYRASQAGASVDLVVRGRCCLRPGVPGLSSGIRVRSVVGRFLEHSRLYRFGGVAGRPLEVLIGSADLMERNLDRRIEVLVPVDDPAIQQAVGEILDLAVRDEANSWTLDADGRWTRVAGDGASGPLGFSSQDHLRMRALESRRTRRAAPMTTPKPRLVPATMASPTATADGVADDEGRSPTSAHTPAAPSPAAPSRWWHRLLRRRR
jgi:polyphosphate kinase